jgi:hypothetical protein
VIFAGSAAPPSGFGICGLRFVGLVRLELQAVEAVVVLDLAREQRFHVGGREQAIHRGLHALLRGGARLFALLRVFDLRQLCFQAGDDDRLHQLAHLRDQRLDVAHARIRAVGRELHFDGRAFERGRGGARSLHHGLRRRGALKQVVLAALADPGLHEPAIGAGGDAHPRGVGAARARGGAVLLLGGRVLGGVGEREARLPRQDPFHLGRGGRGGLRSLVGEHGSGQRAQQCERESVKAH